MTEQELPKILATEFNKEEIAGAIKVMGTAVGRCLARIAQWDASPDLVESVSEGFNYSIGVQTEAGVDLGKIALEYNGDTDSADERLVAETAVLLCSVSYGDGLVDALVQRDAGVEDWADDFTTYTLAALFGRLDVLVRWGAQASEREQVGIALAQEEANAKGETYVEDEPPERVWVKACKLAHMLYGRRELMN